MPASIPFTDRARKVMVLAYQEAQRRRDRCVDSGHLLLGLIEEGHGVATLVLRNLAANLDDVRREVDNLLFLVGPGTAMGRLSFGPDAKRVLKYSIEEARSLRHKYTGSEHLLLGLLRDHGSVAARALAKAGVELATARAAVVQIVGVPPGSEKQCPPAISRISPGPLERTIVGLLAFLSALFCGAFAVCFTIGLVAGRPRPLWKTVLFHVVIDLLAVVSIFMLLVAISLWRRSRWADSLVEKTTAKGAAAILILFTILSTAIGIAEQLLGILLAVAFAIEALVFLILFLVRRRNRLRRDREKQASDGRVHW